MLSSFFLRDENEPFCEMLYNAISYRPAQDEDRCQRQDQQLGEIVGKVLKERWVRSLTPAWYSVYVQKMTKALRSTLEECGIQDLFAPFPWAYLNASFDELTGLGLEGEEAAMSQAAQPRIRTLLDFSSLDALLDMDKLNPAFIRAMSQGGWYSRLIWMCCLSTRVWSDVLTFLAI